VRLREPISDYHVSRARTPQSELPSRNLTDRPPTLNVTEASRRVACHSRVDVLSVLPSALARFNVTSIPAVDAASDSPITSRRPLKLGEPDS
jgi:hypothetical protein